jgi:protoporphyrinogen oxidase
MADEQVIDQAEPQSMTDRIANKFGFPGADQAEADSAVQTTESDLAELEWDGAKYQVPVKLKDAFMRNEDYTRKTQDLAEQRKTVDQLREISQTKQMDGVFAESIQPDMQQVAMIDAYLQQVAKMDMSNMSMEAVFRQKMEIDGLKERKAEIKESIAQKRTAFNQSLADRIKELRGKSRELASKSIQGFNEQIEADVRKFAAAEGLAEPEIDNVLLDPRSMKILWKAMQFDKVQAGTVKADNAVKALKPGAASNRMPPETVQKLNFNKAMKGAQTSSEKARVIEQRLSGMFTKGHT